jgi:magnesium transporter
MVVRETTGVTSTTCADYSPATAKVETVADLDSFLTHHRPPWSEVRWVDVVGVGDLGVVRALAAKYELHPLAVEDILSTTQRPKLDEYGGKGTGLNARQFIAARALRRDGDELASTPVSIFLGHTTVLTFQHADSGVWRPTRQRLEAAGSRLRGNDASFLVYALLDAIVDGCFPLIDHYDDRLELLEAEVLDGADRAVLTQIQHVKRQLATLRSSVWPLREVVAALQRDPHECMSETTKVYLHDLYDHIVQLIEIIETYRERAKDLAEAYRSSVSARTNDVMKVLTVIGTVFIPLTFLAGVYGMNFRYLPELDARWAYPAFWLVCGIVAASMAAMFHRKKWF